MAQYSPKDDNFGFAGQRGVPGAGLVFMHARYYDARLGRFVSADTVVPGAGNPQALNRYAYGVGNPVKYNDPSGHAFWQGEDLDSLTGGRYHAPIERGWTTHDTKVVAGALGTLVVGAGAETIVLGGAAADAASVATYEVGWRALKWTLGHPTLARILGIGGPGTAQAARAATDEGTAVALRQRAKVWRFWESILRAKQGGEHNVPFIGRLPGGLRIVRTTGGFPIALRVSDVDVAFGVNLGPEQGLMSEGEIMEWGRRFNQAIGRDLVTHGDLVSGRRAGIKAALDVSLDETWRLYFGNGSTLSMSGKQFYQYLIGGD